MLRIVYEIMKSSMDETMGLDNTLTFDPGGHFWGHKVKIVFNMIWLAL